MVLRQARAQDVSRSACWPRPCAPPDERMAGQPCGSPDAEGLCHSDRLAKCVRDWPKSTARGSRGIHLLDERELEGVIAHELAHVKHRDILISSVTATIAATIMMVASMARWAAIFGGFGERSERQDSNPIALLATIILAPLATIRVQGPAEGCSHGAV